MVDRCRQVAQAPASPLRVLHVAETIKGGVATYLASLDAGAGRMGCRFSYLIPASQQAEFEAEHIHLHSARRSLWGILGLARRMVAVRREIRADVVFAHSTFAGFALCLATPFLGTGVKTIYCPHGWAVFREMKERSRRVVAMIERAMSQLPSAVVNISSYEHRQVSRMGYSPRCILIPNAVQDTGRFRLEPPSGRRSIRVLYVGRFDRQKGVDMLAKAIRELGPCPGIEFDLVGESVVEQAGLADFPDWSNVRRHGWLAREAITALYAEADLVVMPSRWEGFGLCAVEAFRAGTPVLARRVGALGEIVSHGHDGYLYDGEAEALCSALKRLRLDELVRMRGNARATFETRFHIDRLYLAYRELFETLVPGRQHGRLLRD